MSTPPQVVPEFLRIEDVSRLANVPISTVRHWLKTKQLASVRPGRRRLVPRSALQTFLARDRTEERRSEEAHFMSTPGSVVPELDRGLWLCQVLERLQYLWIEQVAFGEWEVTTIATHNLSDERVHFHGSSLADALAQCAQWAILDVPSPDEPIRYSVAELPEEHG